MIVDSHLHVWSGDTDTYPLAEGRSVTDAATADLLLETMATTGVDKAVIVQPAHYMYDNRYVTESLILADSPPLASSTTKHPIPSSDSTNYWTRVSTDCESISHPECKIQASGQRRIRMPYGVEWAMQKVASAFSAHRNTCQPWNRSSRGIRGCASFSITSEDRRHRQMTLMDPVSAWLWPCVSIRKSM